MEPLALEPGPIEARSLSVTLELRPADGRPRCCLQGPQTAQTEHGPLIQVVADCRLDGRWELARTLALPPETVSDPELLLGAYRRWGVGCPDHLLGDFSFAIWDAGKELLLCARDVVGARDLHYHLSGDGRRFFAGSDPQDLLASAELPEDLDGYALADFLVGNTSCQARTAFAAVQSVLPGHALSLSSAGPRGWRYWNPDRLPALPYQCEEEYSEVFRELLFEAVKDRLEQGGLPAAVMTSGGLDSSSVVAVAQKISQGSGGRYPRPVAISGVFDRLQDCDERSYSRALRDELGIDLEEVVVDAIEDAGFRPPEEEEAVSSPQRLTGGSSHTFLSAMTRRGCGSVLFGFGGDSLFDGARFQYFDLARSGRWLRLMPWLRGSVAAGASWPAALRSLWLRPMLPAAVQIWADRRGGRGRYRHVPSWLDPGFRSRSDVDGRLRRRAWPQRFDSVARQRQYEGIVGLASQGPAIQAWSHLARCHGLETRFPLLDRRLAEFVLAVPMELLAKPGPAGTKWLLRRSMEGTLPESIRARPGKTGWGGLRDELFGKRYRSAIHGLFSGSRLASLGLVDESVLRRDFDLYCREPAALPSASLFAFPVLLERWLRQRRSMAPALRFFELEAWQRE